MAEACPDCSRPVAAEETDLDDVHCFAHLDRDGRQGTNFALRCLTLAVSRLRTDRRLLAAAHALQGILSDGHNAGIEHGDPLTVGQVAMWARQYGDALIAEVGRG